MTTFKTFIRIIWKDLYDLVSDYFFESLILSLIATACLMAYLFVTFGIKGVVLFFLPIVVWLSWRFLICVYFYFKHRYWLAKELVEQNNKKSNI